jgi:hypothetical protein
MSQSVLDIILRSKKEGTGVKDSKKEIDDLGDSTSKFGDIAKGVAVAGVGALVAGLTYAVNQAMETERVMRATEQVIRSTGGAAGMTADAVSGLAGELSAMSGIDDEMIQSAENVLLTFTSIGADVFPQATKAALDMSAALGTDLQSAVTMIGKALQDPVAGVSALTKVGVNFNDTAKETIKQMVAMNDVAGAQKFILKELNTEFGGMAEALGSTVEGKINKATNAIDNLAAAIGEKLLPVIGDAADAANILITGADQIRAAYDAVSLAVRNNSKSYAEYKSAIEGTARAAGYIRDVFIVGQGTVTQYDASIKILTETQFNATQGAYGYASGLDESNRAAQRAAEGAAAVSSAEAAQAANIQAGVDARARSYEAMGASVVKQQEMIAADEAAAAANAIYRAGIAETTGKIESMAQALMKSTDAQAKQMLAQASLDAIKKAYEGGTISQDSFSKATETVLLKYDLATPKSIAMADAQQRVTDAFLSGELPLKAFIESSDKIPKIAEDGAISMQELSALGISPTTKAAFDQRAEVEKLSQMWLNIPKTVKTVYTIEVKGDVPGQPVAGRAGGGPVTESVPVNINELNRERLVPYASGSMVPATTNNNLGPVSINIHGAGQNAQAIAQAVAIELGRMTNLAVSSGAGMLGM